MCHTSTSISAVTSFICQHRFYAFWHGTSQGLAHSKRNVSSPNFLNALYQMLLGCRIHLRNLSLHHFPGVLNYIEIRWIAWPRLNKSYVWILKPLLHEFCVVAWCTVMLKVCGPVNWEECVQFIFENAQVCFTINCCVFGHYPKSTSTTESGHWPPNHYFLCLFHRRDRVFGVVTFQTWSAYMTAEWIKLSKSTLQRTSRAATAVCRPWLVFVAERNLVTNILRCQETFFCWAIRRQITWEQSSTNRSCAGLAIVITW